MLDCETCGEPIVVVGKMNHGRYQGDLVRCGCCAPASPVVLEIHGWHTQCGACGYGRGGWAGGPAREGKPILTPESRTCHGCGEPFTHTLNVYRDLEPQAIPAEELPDAA